MSKEPDPLDELVNKAGKLPTEEVKRFHNVVDAYQRGVDPIEIVNEVDPVLEATVTEWRKSKEYKKEFAQQTKALRRKKQ